VRESGGASHRRFFALKNGRRRTVNDMNTTRKEMRIGGTTYIVNTSYNGDKRFDPVKSIIRLIKSGAFAPPG